MNNKITEKLLALANALDQKGLYEEADIIAEALRTNQSELDRFFTSHGLDKIAQACMCED